METDTIISYHNVAIGSDFKQFCHEDQVNKNEIAFPYAIERSIEVATKNVGFFFDVTNAYIDQYGGSGSVDAITVYLRNESEGSISAFIQNAIDKYGVFSYYYFDEFQGKPISDSQKIVPGVNGSTVDVILSQAEINRETIVSIGDGLANLKYQMGFVWLWKNCEIRISVSTLRPNFNDIVLCLSKCSEWGA